MNVAIVCVSAVLVGAAGLAGIRGVSIDARPVAPAATTVTGSELKAEYAIDGGHSSVIYGVTHMGVSRFWGRFDKMSGTFVLDDEGKKVLAADVTVKADSVSTGIKGRDDHLKSADFFSVSEFPEITFKGNQPGDAADTLKGDLTMLGKTVPVSAKVTLVATNAGGRGGPIGGFEARFTVKRSDFGMNYGLDGNALGDEVEMIVSFEGKKN